MVVTNPVLETVEYCCPGERSPVSRAVHLGRLARFYPACRRCPHALDTGTHSARLVKRLAETRGRGEPRPLFDDEGASGVYQNDLDPAAATRMAAALGVSLRRERSDGNDPPVAVIAGDGRPLTPELVAAVGEGLRWTGCHVVEIAPATSACVAFAIDHLHGAGGILVGNPAGEPHTVGLRFWGDGGWPLSAEGPLDVVREIFHAGTDRPARKYGSLRRLQAEVPYLAGMSESYHGLRPLRFLLDATSRPLAGYLDKLTGPTACKVVPCRVLSGRLPDQVREDQVHFGVRVDEDGERCGLFDERGRAVAGQQLLLLVARHLLARHPGAAVVLDEGSPAELARAVGELGARVVISDPRRSEMARAMRENRAVFGGSASGRFWYRSAGHHGSADALMTISLLLRLLSQSDRRLSEVLDAEVPLR